MISAPPQTSKRSRRESVRQTGRDQATGEDLSGEAGKLAAKVGGLDLSAFDPLSSVPAGHNARTQRSATIANPRGAANGTMAQFRKFKKNEDDSSSDSSSDSDSDSSSSSDSSDSDSSSDSGDESSDLESDNESDKKPKPRKKPATKPKPSADPKPVKAAPPAGAPPAFTTDDNFTAPAQPRARAATAPSPGGAARSGEKLMKVDVLKHMRLGTPFLKYGKRGYPHFRQFQLSEDNMRLMWFSSGKKVKDSQVRLSDVDDIRMGQTTPNFSRHQAPELSKNSFSLIYRNRRETLDLIAKDPNEFKIWHGGLKAIFNMLKQGKALEVSALKEMPLTLSVTKNRRSTAEIFDFDTGECADDGTGSMVRKNRGSYNKQMYKTVAKSFQTLKKNLAKKRKEVRSQQYYMSPTYENMDHVLKKIQASVERINDWFQNGEYEACDDEIWRAGVDLASLEQMMAAVKKS